MAMYGEQGKDNHLVNDITPEGHAERLGRLVANLHWLEFMVRAFLFKLHDPRAPDPRLDCAKIGELVDVNRFTSWDDLGNLLPEYNEQVRERWSEERALSLPESEVLALRNAIAHGRVFRRGCPGPPYHLMKFSKPGRGTTKVTVECKHLMTIEWFESQIGFLADQVRTVSRAYQCLERELAE